jgi:hypothetical protein
MAHDIKAVWLATTGKEPTDTDLNKINQIVHSSGMTQDDAMSVVITMLSAQFSNSPLNREFEQNVAKKTTETISSFIVKQVSEERQVATITQQLKLIGMTSAINLIMVALVAVLFAGSAKEDNVIELEPQWMSGCISSGNMPLAVVDDKGTKKCVLVGKDGKIAKDGDGRPITWTLRQ